MEKKYHDLPSAFKIICCKFHVRNKLSPSCACVGPLQDITEVLECWVTFDSSISTLSLNKEITEEF
jgi:hypothetical protein